ncbi:hypothetical protein RAS1_41000 [Phycisphaerae bacterium RAS1]|nr:hypothetical protein RAS1_41000 [Phycisphaerae bacterium RAS1]
MSDMIKCACSHCGAKYRLPLEAQGRAVRCKKCNEKFEVPKSESLEESILSWLTDPDDEREESTSEQPKVINMAAAGGEAKTVSRGLIRMKDGSSTGSSSGPK